MYVQYMNSSFPWPSHHVLPPSLVWNIQVGDSLKITATSNRKFELLQCMVSAVFCLMYVYNTEEVIDGQSHDSANMH